MIKTGVKLPSLEYGLTVVALAVPMLILGMEFVNLIELVYSGPITKISEVVSTFGG